MPEEFYDLDFPDLNKLGFERTSAPDASYRCLSFAIGETAKNWWPGDYPASSDDFWPVPYADSGGVAAFLEGLATIGFVPCGSGDVEAGYDKIALYALHDEVRHAARQMTNSRWQSKLGPDEDIAHPLAGLEGPLYGKVVAFLKRPKIQ